MRCLGKPLQMAIICHWIPFLKMDGWMGYYKKKAQGMHCSIMKKGDMQNWFYNVLLQTMHDLLYIVLIY